MEQLNFLHELREREELHIMIIMYNNFISHIMYE